MKISIILLAHNEEKNISYEIDLVKKNNRGSMELGYMLGYMEFEVLK